MTIAGSPFLLIARKLVVYCRRFAMPLSFHKSRLAQLRSQVLWPLVCLLVVLALRMEASAQTLVPYLQSPTPTSMWVSWYTPTGTDSTVTYGTSPTALTSTATAPTSDTKVLGTNYNWHTVNLTGLTPNTFYYYKVQTGTQTSAVQRMRSHPEIGLRTGHYRVLVAGDNQIQSPTRWRSLLSAARTKIEALYGVPLEEAINLVVNDGDQVDSGTIAQWQNVHFNMVNVVAPNVPVQTSIGNHEGYSDTNYNNYKGHFRYDSLKYGNITSPGSPLYYAYQVATVVFIHLNTEDNSAAQANWVQTVVNAANADPNVDFIVTVQHRPYNVELYVGDISPWFGNTILPILGSSPKSVLDISGHHHMYARGQVKNYPMYHIIAGGSAWDEYWGQSTQQDMDNVQKTICNWTWTVLDFDLATKKMTAETYSEGGPLMGAANGQSNTANNTVGFYTSKFIDRCWRQIGLAAPATPALTVTNPGTIALPYTFQSTAFSTTTTETLNTTEFQVASDSAFTQVVKDVVRDFENLYLDSGSPNYLPIDQNAGVNIRNYTIPTNGIPNGSYFIRVRHRDSNVSWSGWSAAVPFTVSGSVGGTPSLALDKTVYPVVNASNPVRATYKFGTGLAKDWVGIYQKGQTPGTGSGTSASTTYSYVNTTNGNTLSSGTLALTATLTTKKEYFAAFFTNDGYTEIAPRVNFYVGSIPTLAVSQDAYPVGSNVTITYSGAPGVNGSDWIGVYKVGDTPGPIASTQWYYLSTGAAGTMNFTNLPKGYYFANYFVNGGYTAIGNTVSFAVGTDISTVTMAAPKVQYGNAFTVTYSKGPGNLKDYIGIFYADATPGGSGPRDKLVYYVYPDVLGSPNATVNIPVLPSGSYKMALFTNDSYTNVSPFVFFTIDDPRSLQLDPKLVNASTLELSWPGQTGVRYLVEGSPDMQTWSSVGEITPINADTVRMSVPIATDGPRFFRLLR